MHEEAVKFRPLTKSWVSRGLPDVNMAQGFDVRHDEGYPSRFRWLCVMVCRARVIHPTVNDEIRKDASRASSPQRGRWGPARVHLQTKMSNRSGTETIRTHRINSTQQRRLQQQSKLQECLRILPPAHLSAGGHLYRSTKRQDSGSGDRSVGRATSGHCVHSPGCGEFESSGEWA